MEKEDAVSSPEEKESTAIMTVKEIKSLPENFGPVNLNSARLNYIVQH